MKRAFKLKKIKVFHMYTEKTTLRKLVTFDEENLSDYLGMFDALKYHFNAHDPCVDKIVVFLTAKNEKLLNPLATYFTAKFDCNDNHEYIPFLFYHMDNEQLNMFEEALIETAMNATEKYHLNLEVVRQLLEKGTTKREEWIELLQNAKNWVGSWVEAFLNGDTKMDYQTFINFTSLALMAMPAYLNDKYSVDSTNFYKWSSENEEYVNLIGKAKNSYFRTIDQFISFIK
ncbi:hypothetical protein [Brevibacillus parabrevis]|nr:hypothetical protein [Brevibacillus parabrevis]RNB95478.1 hypothetical protein EDM60_12555 [Brevibacillus parabrevis]